MVYLVINYSYSHSSICLSKILSTSQVVGTVQVPGDILVNSILRTILEAEQFGFINSLLCRRIHTMGSRGAFWKEGIRGLGVRLGNFGKGPRKQRFSLLTGSGGDSMTGHISVSYLQGGYSCN